MWVLYLTIETQRSQSGFRLANHGTNYTAVNPLPCG